MEDDFVFFVGFCFGEVEDGGGDGDEVGDVIVKI